MIHKILTEVNSFDRGRFIVDMIKYINKVGAYVKIEMIWTD